MYIAANTVDEYNEADCIYVLRDEFVSCKILKGLIRRSTCHMHNVANTVDAYDEAKEVRETKEAKEAKEVKEANEAKEFEETKDAK